MFSKSFKRMKSLLMKSASIQLEIEQESRRPNPDWRRLLTLKKQRLMIKDTLHKLRTKKQRVHFADS